MLRYHNKSTIDQFILLKKERREKEEDFVEKKETAAPLPSSAPFLFQLEN